MKRATLLTALVLLALPITAPAAYAYDATGFLCGFTSVTDPQVEGSQTGEMDGGPLFATDDSGVPVAGTIDLFCTIQVGTNDTHAEADAGMCSFVGTGVVAGACTVTYEVGADEDVYVCSEIWIYESGHTTLFWDDANATWSYNPNVGCALAVSAETPEADPLDPLLCPILGAGDAVLGGSTLRDLWGTCL